jgi:transketolase
MRKTFLSKISNIIPKEKDVIFMTVDMGMWAIKDILKNYPERAMNFGICEDAMISVVSGLSMKGLIPIVFGIQPYITTRVLEQIKMDLAYQKCGANIIGTGAAVDYSKYGYSHYCPEDVGILKMIPGIEFIAPGNAKEFSMLFDETYRNNNPTFFRLSDHSNIYDCDVKFGKAKVVQYGGKATVIAVSTMLDAVIEACSDEDVTILYYTTLEPFDSETLRTFSVSNKILICEPEYVGSITHDVISSFPGRELMIKNIGFPREIFRNYGTYDDKIKYYGLTASKIRETIQKVTRCKNDSTR